MAQAHCAGALPPYPRLDRARGITRASRAPRGRAGDVGYDVGDLDGFAKASSQATEGVYKSVAMQLDFSEVYGRGICRDVAGRGCRREAGHEQEEREEDASACPRLLLRDVDVDVLRAADEAGAD